jgi:hypothetical protein
MEEAHLGGQFCHHICNLSQEQQSTPRKSSRRHRLHTFRFDGGAGADLVVVTWPFLAVATAAVVETADAVDDEGDLTKEGRPEEDAKRTM